MMNLKLFAVANNCFLIFGVLIFIYGFFIILISSLGIFQFDIPGLFKIEVIGIRAESVNLFFPIVIGIVMFFGCNKISSRTGKVGQANKKDKKVPVEKEMYEGGFTVSEEEFRIDLRKRKELKALDHLGCELSETERLVRMVIKDVDPKLKELYLRHATTGHSIQIIDTPKDSRWLRIQKPSENLLNPFVDLLVGNTRFQELFRKKGQMSSYYLAIPAQGSKGKEINYKLRYNNAFKGSKWEWAGKEFRADTDKFQMIILFPKKKPFKSIETYKEESQNKAKVPLEDPDIEEREDSLSLKWTITNAKKGEIYLIRWKW